MAIYDALRELTRHWDEVRDALAADQADRLADLVRELAERPGDEDEALVIGAEICTLLGSALAAEHPVRQAIYREPDDTLYASATIGAQDWAGLSGILVALLAGPPSGEMRDWFPLPEIVAREAQEWLLAEPALTPAQVMAHGHDPQAANLIRLSGGDRGEDRIPAFQFDAGGRPIPLVLTINELLEADEDPWGVADWWLGRNAWLEAVPAELVGRVSDEHLLAAARAEVGE